MGGWDVRHAPIARPTDWPGLGIPAAGPPGAEGEPLHLTTAGNPG